MAVAVMLAYPEPFVPRSWVIRGIPPEEFALALERDADPKAVQFLEEKRDARLYALREYGWVRTAKNKWNVWTFDCATAEMVRKSDYWKAQYSFDKYDMLDVEEFKGKDSYSISAQKLLDGGNPEVLKNLAMGHIVDSDKEEALCPHYSTAKYGELAREKLYGRSGANPRRRR